MDGERSLALQTERIVGRERELAAIDWALSGVDRTRALLFIGPGGIGKTRLLTEADEQARQRGLLSSGIIDLYHSDTHSNSGIEAAIIDTLDPKGVHFQEYWGLRTEFERLRHEFVGAARLEELRERLADMFVAGFNAISQGSRVLLAFDTAELIQFESDVVQHICQVEEGAVEVRDWMMAIIPRLQNAAVLLAGRGPRYTGDPRERLWDEFRAAFGKAEGKGFTWQGYSLESFTEEESLAYFSGVARAAREREQECVAEGHGEEGDFFHHAADTIEHIRETVGRTIHYATEGRPVRLGLVIDLAVRGDIEDLFVPGDENGHSPEEMWTVMVPRLVEAIQQLYLRYPVQDTLRYLAVARQGLDSELLHHLEPGWSLGACQERLEAIAPLSFVKTRPGTRLMFLHDEMYDILERELILPSREAFVPNYQRIAKYYAEQLEPAQGKDRREQEDLEIHLLHYRLREHPRQGYERDYTSKSEFAIKGHEVGFDMRLRDEMLGFFSQPHNQQLADLQGLTRDGIDRDSAVRWIKRHIARGKYERAVEVAEAILFFGPEPYHSIPARSPSATGSITSHLQQEAKRLFTVNALLFWGRVLTYYGEALSFYGGQKPEGRALPVLQEAIDLLAGFEPGDEYQDWWRARILGRAYMMRGYAYRSAFHLQLSIKNYHAALHHYRQSDVPDEMAETLNNAAFVYALLGDILLAEKWADDALLLRRELGQNYPLALSLNTRGLIHLLAKEPHEALARCQEALRLCRELEDWRGQGMACNALGEIYCALGDLHSGGVYSSSQAVNFYKQAEEALNQAVRIFTVEAHERQRLVEAYNERGDVYRHWGALLWSDGQEEEATRRFEQALEDYERSLREARKSWPVDRADCYEDMAHLFTVKGELERAEQCLKKAETLVPKEYRLVKGKGFPEIEEPVEGFWQVMGKIHLARGHIVNAPVRELESLTEEQEAVLMKAVEQYALGVAYFLRYSPEKRLHRGAFAAIYDSLKKRGIPRLTKARECINAVSKQYGVNLDPLLEEIDAALGLSTSASLR